MDHYTINLYQLLLQTYRTAVKVESQALKCVKDGDISVNELHLLEVVGRDMQTGRTVGDVARELDVTMPSATIAINKLFRKGYVEKKRCEKDNRIVYVRLTRMGKKMNSAHRRFNGQMARGIVKGFTEKEKEVLVRAFRNLSLFLDGKSAEYEKYVQNN